MDLLKFNNFANEVYGDNRKYDLLTAETIKRFYYDYFSHTTMREFMDMFNFKKFLITDIPKEFEMNVDELNEFATILFIDDMYAVVNVDF